MPSEIRSGPLGAGRGTKVGIPTALLATLRPGLCELLKAYEYARTPVCLPWELAVEIGRLRSLGMTESDLRWLVRMGYVEHARETTRLEDDGRDFHPTGNLSFCKRTCFVLTETGVEFIATEMGDLAADAASEYSRNGHARPSNRTQPHWDCERHKLVVGDQLVKQYKWPADNQESILSAFEEEGWPPRIDDPLVPVPDQDPKRRLHDTIKCLNRNQKNRLIHFRGDGTGEGIVWEHAEEL